MGIILLSLIIFTSLANASKDTERLGVLDSGLLLRNDADSTRLRIISKKKFNIPEYGFSNVLEKILNTRSPEAVERKEDWEKYFDKNEYGFSKRIKEYDALDLRAKFTYNILNYEDYIQACGGNWPMFHGSGDFIYPSVATGRQWFQWSRRQRDYFLLNRDSVLKYIDELCNAQGFIGHNTKFVIGEIDGWELIPQIIDDYDRNTKDAHLLTLLVQLMEQGKFGPFVKSYYYDELYKKNSRTESVLNFTHYKGIPQKIIALAEMYYQEKIK